MAQAQTIKRKQGRPRVSESERKKSRCFRIQDSLWFRISRQARREGRTITSILEDCILNYLAEKEPKQS